MPIKMAEFKIVINQSLTIAIGFVAGVTKKFRTFAVQQEFCA
jgi:hypothetical protein